MVRVISINSQETPASQELERVISALFEQRSRVLESEVGPVPVWALVIPPDEPEIAEVAVKEARRLRLEDGNTYMDEKSWGRPADYSELLGRGCKFFRIGPSFFFAYKNCGSY